MQGSELMVWELVRRLRQEPYIQIEDVESEDIPLKDEKGFYMAN